MIRVGIVGYGFAGRGFHAYLISRVPELKLTAVASRAPERRDRAAQDYGVATFATLEDLLERGEVDLVVLATPHDVHAAQAIQAMDAGKHVVVDKIMCLNVAEADAMIAASERNRVLLSVFHNRRWDGDYLTVKKVLAEGLIGEPYLFETSVMRYHGPRGWRGDPDVAGGILYDWGAHLIDQALQLVPGPVASVTCDVLYHSWGARIGSYGRLLLRFASGVRYNVEVGNLARYDRPHWLILGDRGSLVKHGLDPQEAAMLRGNIDAATEDPSLRARVRTEIAGLETELVVETARGDWTAHYRNVADAVEGRGDLAVRPEQVRRAIRVFDAATLSAKTGETVRVEA